MSYSSIAFAPPVVAIPRRVELLDIAAFNIKFKRFSDGTDRKFVSVSKIKDTLSYFDKMGVSEGMAEKEINKKGIYAPDALDFGYDPESAEWYIENGRERYQIAYDEYCDILKSHQDAILADWEHRGNVGKERGNFVDIAFDRLCNRQKLNADVHCAEHSLYQEKPFTPQYLVELCNDFTRLKTCLLDLLGTTLVTQYLAHFNMKNVGWNYGFATLGDLMILNKSKKEFFFFDVKADKSEKMYPNAQAQRYEKPMLGQMSIFKDNLKNKYFFQVICSLLCVEQEGGVWDNGTWIDLSIWTYAGGGIIHWNHDTMRFNIIHLPNPRSNAFSLMKAKSKDFIRDYFVELKKSSKK